MLLLLLDTLLADRRGRRARRGTAVAHTAVERGAAALLLALSLGLSSCARNNDSARGAEADRIRARLREMRPKAEANLARLLQDL